MAIIRPSALVGAVSGAVGGVVFVQGRRSAVVRSRPQKLTKSTETGMLVARQHQSLVQLWAELPASERTAWTRIGQNLGRRNRWGQGAPMTGFEAYLSYWATANLNTTGQAGVIPIGQYTAPEIVLAALFYAGASLTVGVSPSVETGTVLCALYGARQFRDTSGPAPNRWVYLTKIPRSVMPADIFSAWASRLGDLRAGEYYWIGCRSKVTNQFYGPMVTFEGVAY